MNITKSTLLALCLLYVLLPQVTLAYFTTNQHASKLKENVALYAIEYTFGLEKYDMYMPVLAERGLFFKSIEEKVGYSFIKNKDQVQTEGTATGLVLAGLPIENGMYKLEKGKAHKLVLVVLFSTPTSEYENDYALKVDRLPFYVDMGGPTLDARSLNPSELQYYITKEVELNTGNFR